MPHFYAEAVRQRLRVSIHHYSDLCPVTSGTEFATIGDAILALGLHDLGWNPDRDCVRHEFYRELVSLNYRTGYWLHADVSFRNLSGRFINPDIVIGIIEELTEARRSARGRSHPFAMRPDDFRMCPVPHTGRRHRARIRRRIRTTAERREAACVSFDADVSEVGIRARAKRSFCNLPEYRDDIYRSDRRNDGWKSNRKTQWRIVE
ncbi:hypothetical protein G6L37_04985 [Agrobacterium rubi]|nr:hypothetical protein [Agrobacterium rubi]NTF24710.1 hypothetical protein [Agrobacterium rubi]